MARGEWFFLVATAIVTLFMSKPYLYAVQQDNYRLQELFKSRKIRTSYVVDLISVAVFCAVWGGFWFVPSKVFWGFTTVLFAFVTEFALYFADVNVQRKKPLRYTRRAFRLMLGTSLVSTAVVTSITVVMNLAVEEHYYHMLTYLCFPLIFPLCFMLALCAVNPLERLNNRRYEWLASRTLAARKDLIKIAVTGSAGKTSVKNHLAKMLETRYSTLKTPESYNTPLGIAVSLNGLDATHEVFVAEMGARRKGDIKRLMRIIKPNYTVVSAINRQHLETFKKFENIVREKLQAVDMLGENGVAVVNADCINYLLPYEMTGRTVLSAGIWDGEGEEPPFCYASNVSICNDGTEFTLGIDGRHTQVWTSLLGENNVTDITLAAAIAYELGIALEDIALAVRDLEAVPHRLQLVEGNGIKIIDDSFNSNPDGARVALKTLHSFVGRKVVLTPGLVELGEKESEENYALGVEIASVADFVMLIGSKRTAEIKRGLSESGYEMTGGVAVYRSLEDAKKSFAETLRVGDVLLILNDLPDCYDE